MLIVNYTVADGKSNWLEGVILMSLYIMLAVTFWYYPGASSWPGCAHHAYADGRAISHRRKHLTTARSVLKLLRSSRSLPLCAPQLPYRLGQAVIWDFSMKIYIYPGHVYTRYEHIAHHPTHSFHL